MAVHKVSDPMPGTRKEDNTSHGAQSQTDEWKITISGVKTC